MTPHAPQRPVDILLVEDNAADIRLITELLGETGTPHRLSVARNGHEALAFLRREGTHAEAPRPGIILLDLNLPRKDGREVLASIKQDPALRRIPVLVLTTSNAEQDIVKSYDLHANCYIVKPVDLERSVALTRAIASFWLTVATLPPGD